MLSNLTPIVEYFGKLNVTAPEKLRAALRFLNLLEPGRNIVSITKVAMWLSVAVYGYCSFTGTPLDINSTVAFFSVSSLYAWRRFVQWKTGTILPTEGDTTVPTSPIG